jgi:hypothetical protein
MNQIEINDIHFDLSVPKYVLSMSLENQKEISIYLQQLNEIEKKAYLIAYNHLGSSFNIYRSNGFKDWKNKK